MPTIDVLFKKKLSIIAEQPPDGEPFLGLQVSGGSVIGLNEKQATALANHIMDWVKDRAQVTGKQHFKNMAEGKIPIGGLNKREE